MSKKTYQAAYGFSKELCAWSGTDEAEAKKILGGKGAALVKMAKDGLNVPPGFTYTTEICNRLAKMDDEAKDAVYEQLRIIAIDEMTKLREKFGFIPLVSVRSGAPVSMPGMMDTILNVGLTDLNIGLWETRIGARSAWDSYRRLIQMLGATAFGIPAAMFDNVLHDAKVNKEVENDADLDVDDLKAVVDAYKAVFQNKVGHEFPQGPISQLMAAIRAVFNSWMNPRAIEYRKLNNIDPSMGTACTVQTMVFGNMGDDSGTGVLFTRNPSTGENKIMGEFLPNAQGEDVVAGIRTPLPLSMMANLDYPWPTISQQIVQLCEQLEESYKDMVDIEFTVQKGELFVLQSRVGKRSARAAFKIAHDLVQEGVIDWPTAAKRLTRQQFKVVRRPSLDPSFKTKPDVVGLPACPGVVSGRPVFSSEEALNTPGPTILISHETTPDDIAGMNAAVGILTQTGGATSHAAVVARAMDKTCVVGATDLNIGLLQSQLDLERVTIDGATGNVWFNTVVPVVDGSEAPEVKAFIAWATAEHSVTSTLDLGEDIPHTICASHWWGQTAIAELVIDGLKALKTRENVIIDVRPPVVLQPDVDAELRHCFGETVKADHFEWWLLDRLQKEKEALKGLKVVTTQPSLSVFPSDVSSAALPDEYIAFCRLVA